METNQFLTLPFPYFYVNKNLDIIASSINGFEKMRLRDLFQVDIFSDFQHFLMYSPENHSEAFFLTLPEDKPSQYRLYKKNDNECIHLFCHPMETASKLSFEQMNNMRQKLILYREQNIKNEEKIAKLQSDYDEIALQSTYFTNVGNLAAGIAHEIRNPLTTVKGFIQLIRPYLVEIQKEEYADIALNEIDRANKILFQFLNAAKPQLSELNSIHINKLIREIGLLYEGEANLNNITIQTIFAPENPTVLINESQLKQVIINMMKNAVEAIYASHRLQGKICLSTEVKGNEVVIKIMDNGCGMTTESLDTLFTPFFTTKSTGTGLGLTICKKIINEHGGNIHINSKFGKGTTFHIELPLQKDYILHA